MACPWKLSAAIASWTLTSADEFVAAAAGGIDQQRALALEVGRRNAEAIRSCTLLAAYLDGQEPDSGTVVEVGYACGGVCACSTCHVVVKEGLESCNEATDAELDELDEAPGITPKSRLGCQTVPDGTTDIVVEIPDWNKNYAKEADH